MIKEAIVRQIAVDAARGYPEVYYKEPFEPHEWVLKAVLKAYEEGYEEGHRDGFGEGYDLGEAENAL